MNTLETLQGLLIEEFNLNREQLTPDTKLAQLGVDSLALLELLFKIEDRFGLKIKDDAPTSLVTLNDVVVYIDSLLARPMQEPMTGGVETSLAD